MDRSKRPTTPREVVDSLVQEGSHPGIVFFEGARRCRRLEARLIRDTIAELQKVRALPRDVRALIEAVDPDLPDDEVQRGWQEAIDGLRVLFHASPKGTARERNLLLDVARDRKLVAAMRTAIEAGGEAEPTWLAVFLAEGSRESQAVAARFTEAYAAQQPELLRHLETFRGAAAASCTSAGREGRPSTTPPAATGKRAPPDPGHFWELLERAGETAADPVESLRELLEGLSPTQVAAFHRWLFSMLRKADRYDLWGAAYLMQGGCSDDAFRDFRAGLVARGRAVFEQTLADPDSLAEHTDLEGNEALPGVAGEVYFEKTGKPLPPVASERARPIGKRWNFDDEREMRRRYPRLYERVRA